MLLALVAAGEKESFADAPWPRFDVWLAELA
jgi:hypothetical protein